MDFLKKKKTSEISGLVSNNFQHCNVER